MDFFQTSHPIRKIGQNEYIIGSQPLNPLVKIKGEKLIVKEIDTSILSLNSGSFGILSGEFFYSNYINLSGLNVYEELINQNQALISLSGSLQQASLNTGSQVNLSNYESSRLLLEEAFEYDEVGDIVPTNHPYISDPMWILKDDNNLELRANIWRYDTGPDAFTKDISF